MQIQTEQTEQDLEQPTIQSLSQQTTEPNTTEAHETLATNAETIRAQMVIMKLKRQARTRWYLNLVYATVLIIPFLLVLNTNSSNPFWHATYWSIIASVSGLFYLAAWLQMRQANKVISNINDIKLIGPLAEALDAERFLKPKQVVAALRRLLPRLQASDADLLTREQRACLYRSINRQSMRAYNLYDKGLAVDVLKALQQIGDREALPHVKRAAKWSQSRPIRDAANDCLEFLLEKEEAFKRSEQYLRPSSASAVQTGQADALLRPASAHESQTAPEQLLRASKQESEE